MATSEGPVTVILPQAPPIDDFMGPEFAQSTSGMDTRSSSKTRTTCTACGASKDVYNDKLYEHPVLKVLVCEQCHVFYHQGPFTKDSENMDEQCRWCGQGGNLLMCDCCTNVFCNYCIKRNFSPDVFNKIRDADEWKCFICEPQNLRSKRKDCEEVMQKRKDEAGVQSQFEKDQQEVFFDALSEDSKRLDDLIEPLESPSFGKHSKVPLHIKRDPEDALPNPFANLEQHRKVPPVTILREKESYVIQQRSVSCDESVAVKDNSRWQSDPENLVGATRPKFSPRRQASLNYGSKRNEEPENDMNKANATETATRVKKAGQDQKSDEKIDQVQEMKQDQPSDKNNVKSASSYNSMDKPAQTDGMAVLPRRNVGKRTGQKVSTVWPDATGQFGEKSKQVLDDHVTESSGVTTVTKSSNQDVMMDFEQSNKFQPSVHSKMEKASEHLLCFMQIYKELMMEQVSTESWNKFDASQSPSQYSRFRTTNMLLTNVKKASSKLIRMEHDLRAQKTQLGTFREYNDSDVSLSSTDEELYFDQDRKRKRSSLLNSSYKSGDGKFSAKKALEFEAKPVPHSYAANDPTISKNQISESRIPLVVLKKLSPEEIEHLSQSSRKVDSDSDTSLDSLDTDSSKNIQPNSDSDVTTLGENESDVERPEFISNSRRDRTLSRGGRTKRIRRYEKDSDYELESDDHTSSSVRSEFEMLDKWELDDEALNLESNNNNIAKEMILQKMQQQGGDTSDSDVEKLVDKAAGNSAGNENREQNLKPQSASGTDEESNSDSIKKRSSAHPLLKEKWKHETGMECDANKPRKEGKNPNSDRKRRKNNDKEKMESSCCQSVTNGFDASNSDSYQTTDSEADLPVKKRKLCETKPKKMVLDSDSDADCVIISEDNARVNKGSVLKKEESSSDGETDSGLEAKPSQPARKKRRRLLGSSGSEKEATAKQELEEEIEESASQKKGRKNIRKILDDDELSLSTQMASKEEMQRRKRLAAEQAHEEEKEEIIIIDEDNKTEMRKTVVLRLVLSKDPKIEVHQDLIKHMKPHQIEGIRFLWDNLIEKVKVANMNRGNGCILAHCMGLGKTLQTVAFLHTVLMSKYLPKLRTVLVLCPLGTVNNWMAEFQKWVPKFSNGDGYKFRKLCVLNLNSVKSENDRLERLEQWYKQGGVVVMGYGLFRSILSGGKRQTQKSKEIFKQRLQLPGPDILVCDEGHILKNTKTSIACMVQSVETRRKIILTGTPLQNNMIEYHCMVSIVKPRLLGTLREFKNRFMNPIENGQHGDSTESDVKLMKKRAHVLHELLSGCVQRKDYSCLRIHLAAKQEYTLKVRLSDLQIRLYEKYLTMHSSTDVKAKKTSLFNDFNNLLSLVCHPKCLIMAKERRVRKENGPEEEGETESEEEDLSSDDSVISVSEGDEPGSQVPKPSCLDDIYALSGWKLRLFIEDKSGKKPETRSRKKLINLAAKYLDENFCKTKEFEESLKQKSVSQLKAMISDHGGSFLGCTEKLELISIAKSLVLKQTQTDSEWFEQFMPKQEKLLNANEHSGKIMVMLDILQGAAKLGDKVVIFSQSLLALDLIEEVLKAEMKAMGKGLKPLTEPFAKWHRDKDYYRLDGSTPGNLRDKWISKFNDKSNARGRLFLISTRAGGIGINLIGANRAIVFDASWNPTHDVQSIFRIYRFGQVKPCFIYRLVAQGTMEEKIYERQVMKRSLAFRVVDEQQIERHFSSTDIAALYTFKPPPKPDSDKRSILDLPPPRDALLASILLSSSNVLSYHEPDSLLDHQVSEELSEAERQAAWEEYDLENTVQRNGSVSSLRFFSSFPVPVLFSIRRKSSEIIKLLQTKIAQIKTQPFNVIMLEMQIKNRALSAEDVMGKAVEEKLKRHIMLRRLNQLKAKIMKYKNEADFEHMIKTSTPCAPTVLSSSSVPPSITGPNPSNAVPPPSAGPSPSTRPQFTTTAQSTSFFGSCPQTTFPRYQTPFRHYSRGTPPSRFASRGQFHQYRPRHNSMPRSSPAPRPPPPPRTRVPFQARFTRRGLNNNAFRFAYTPTTQK